MARRIVFPASLRNAVTKLTASCGRSVYLVGTAHVSKQSVVEVQQTIDIVQPAVVFLELCHQRENLLTADASEMRKKLTWQQTYEKLVSGQENVFGVLYSSALRDISEELEVLPGEEFRGAYESARRTGCTVVLGDRPLNITLSRMWHGLRLYEKAMLTGMLIGGGLGMTFSDSDSLRQQVEEMKQNKDALTAELRRMGDRFPWLVHALINERDMFMTLELQLLLREMREKQVDGDVVAVVGAGHVEGMQREWAVQRSAEQMLQLHRNLQRVPSDAVEPSSFISIADLR